MSEPPSRVAVVMAMEAEAAPLLAALGAGPLELPRWARRLPTRLFRAPAAAGPTPRPEVIVGVNGTDPRTGVACIGTTAAALTTQVVLNPPDGRRPDLVLSVGTAGGWHRAGASVGDCYLAWPSFVCHDRRIDLPGFQEFADGRLPATDLRTHAAALGCRLGIVTTGDSLDESPTDRERIEASGAEVKEMEAVAVAWVAHLHGVPVGALKAITDLVDAAAPTTEQFQANLATAASALQDRTLRLLGQLAERGNASEECE